MNDNIVVEVDKLEHVIVDPSSAYLCFFFFWEGEINKIKTSCWLKKVNKTRQNLLVKKQK
jgi:hypothetical protein